MRGIALCCASVVLAGCSLLLSTSDLSEPGTPDAAPSSEAGLDAPGSADSSSDGTAIDAPGVRFCASLSPPPKFCADFDGPGASVDDGWDDVEVEPPSGTSVTLDPMGRAGASALMTVDDNLGCAYSRLGKTFFTNGKGARFSFSYRPTGVTDDSIFAFWDLRGDGADCGIFFRLETTDGQTVSAAATHFQYDNGMRDDIFEWISAPKLGVWSKIEAEIASDGSSIAVILDGDPVSRQTIPAGCTFGSTSYFAPGFHCEDRAHEARFDDVVVDYP
jgi:hypothetical protein